MCIPPVVLVFVKTLELLQTAQLVASSKICGRQANTCCCHDSTVQQNTDVAWQLHPAACCTKRVGSDGSTVGRDVVTVEHVLPCMGI